MQLWSGVTWHADQVRNNIVFDCQQELEDYCTSDVDILQEGCEAFVKQFKQEAGVNPFEQCSTIASACNLYWRKHHHDDDPLKGGGVPE